MDVHLNLLTILRFFFLVYFLFHGLMFYNPSGFGLQRRLGLCFGECSGRSDFPGVSLQSLFDSPRIQRESGSGCQVVACLAVTLQHRLFPCRVHTPETWNHLHEHWEARVCLHQCCWGLWPNPNWGSSKETAIRQAGAVLWSSIFSHLFPLPIFS